MYLQWFGCNSFTEFILRIRLNKVVISEKEDIFWSL